MSSQSSQSSRPVPSAQAPAPVGPLVSPVWVLRGIMNDPGYLVAAGGRVVLTAAHADGPAFDVALGELTDVQWPWWWFGGGFKATVRGTRYKLTFVRPDGAPGPDRGLLSAVGSASWDGSGHSLEGLADVVEGRAQAELWREVVGG